MASEIAAIKSAAGGPRLQVCAMHSVVPLGVIPPNLTREQADTV